MISFLQNKAGNLQNMSSYIRRLVPSKNASLTRLCSSSPSQSTSNSDICPHVYNRNPRNLEKLRIALKPDGLHLDKPGHKYWHKLKVIVGNRHISSEIVHNTGSVAVSASTKEWAINKYLYRNTDHAAYVNLARVLAQRCHEAGIIEFMVDIERNPGTKLNDFVEELEKEGLTLSEPEMYIDPQPTDQFRPEKPWEVHE